MDTTGKVARDVVVLLSSSDDSDTEVEVRPVGSQRSCNSSLSCSQTSGSRPALNLVASQKSSRAISRNPTAAGNTVPARNPRRDDSDQSSSKPPAGAAKSQSQLRAAPEGGGGRLGSVGDKRRGTAAGPVPKQRRLDEACAARNNADGTRSLPEKLGKRLGRQTQQPLLSLSFQKIPTATSSIKKDGTSSHPRADPTLDGSEAKGPELPPHHADSLSWSQKYAPRALEDLVVHKKKLEDLRGWMEATSRNCGRAGSGCLLLTGPPGSGKTTAVQLMAAELGISISEWTPPPCTTWEEHLHNNAGSGWQSGPAYRSKLDEFDDFVGRSSLFPALNLQRSSQAKGNTGNAPVRDHNKDTMAAGHGAEAGRSKPTQEGAGPRNKKILLVDDLPHASGPEHRSRLAGVLSRLAGSSRFPTVVITTTGDRGGGSGSNSNAALGHAHGLHKDLASALETAGVHVLSFNPITVRNAAKALKGVAAKMSVNLADESATDIAEASAGDLHNALESLQLGLLGNRKIRDTPASAAAPATSKPKKGKASAKSKALLTNVSLKGTLGGGMDSGLSVFHALGKLLHNKRDSTLAGGAGRDDDDEGFVELELLAGQDLPGPAPLPALKVSERLRRIPAKADPEKTVIRSQLSNDTVTGYLQENILDFIGDGKVEDAALCADYLSLSDVLGSRQYSRHGTDTSGTISSSVAARGTMWANSCPLSRWQPLRMPAHVVVQKATTHNQEQLASVSLGASYFKQAFTGCRSHIASQVLPFLRYLQHSPLHGPALKGVMPRQWMNVYNGKAALQETGEAGGAGPPEAEDEGHRPDSDGDELEGIEDC